MQPLMNEYASLDATEPVQSDRQKLLEDMIRYNLLNPIHLYNLQASKETNLYVTRVSESLHQLIVNLILEGFVVGFGIVAATLIVLLMIRGKVVPLFNQTINFRQADLERFIK